MPIISNDLINEIRSNLNIIDIISNYLTLTKKGKNYFGVCPFHDDHSPSMSVSEEKQIYTCFSCGASGNVFTFVSEYEHISFIEAVTLLGNKIGYQLSTANYAEKNASEYKIYDLTSKCYQSNLFSSLGKNALAYLTKRNIDKDLIHRFGIGLALNNNQMTDILLSKGYSLNELINLGITTDNSNDFFLNRIIFPIWDLKGKVVAFSGRIYNTKNDSKYLNTKETIIFKKGHILYNYHHVKEFFKKIDNLIIMEGFMDVIRASSVGINNCVATLGIALTKEHLALIKKITNNVILCFDGDQAGYEATIAASKLMETEGLTPKIIRLEEDLDPDEYITKYGKEKFLAHVNKPESLIEFNMNILKKNTNLNDVKDVSHYLESTLTELSKTDDVILIELTLQKLAVEFQINYETLADQYQKIKDNLIKMEQKKPLKIEIPKKEESNYLIAQKNLLYYMLKDNYVIDLVTKEALFFPTDDLRFLAGEIINYQSTYGKLNLANFITYLNPYEDKIKTLNSILSMDLKEIYKEEEINDYIQLINKYNVKRQIAKLTKELQAEKDPIKQAEISKKILEIRKVVLC